MKNNLKVKYIIKIHFLDNILNICFNIVYLKIKIKTKCEL